ncbi:hypothetical protein E05_41780 [Plautia stali symbiont]|nr:hypothetical protein E05_41780 [Plautia stali symbiont]
MDGKFHLFDAIVKAISSVYELPHKTQGSEGIRRAQHTKNGPLGRFSVHPLQIRQPRAARQ